MGNVVPGASSSRTEQSSATLTIDLDAIGANYALLSKKSAPAICSAVVKADAYGLGVGPVALRLAAAGCRHFFVAHAGEGAELRERGDAAVAQSAIYVLGGLSGTRPELFTQHALIPVLASTDDAIAWRAQAVKERRKLPAAIHVDTGMNRLGIPFTELGQLSEDLIASFDIHFVMSHLACSEDAAHPMNEEQRNRFERARAHFPKLKASLANSGGIFLGARYHYDLVRPGYAIYGGNPGLGANPMQSAVRLDAPILQVRDLVRDDTVGYGASFRAGGPMRIATVGVGYADGYPRILSGGRGFGVIAGKKIPTVGRVSMDLMTLDVSAVQESELHPGARVQLIGPDVSLEEIAGAAGTIGYEILTKLGSRYARQYRGVPEGNAKRQS